VSRYEAAAQERGLTLALEPAPDLPAVTVDPYRF